jgi:hypothetical protein
MPTLTASAPASISALAPSRRCHVAGHDAHRVGQLLGAANGIEHPLRMAMGGVDDQQVHPGIDQALGALEPILTHRGGRGCTQPPLLVLGSIRVELRLLDILDGDQADAAAVAVDHQQLLDAVAVQQPLGFGLLDAFA